MYPVGNLDQGASECIPSAIVTAFTAPRQGGVRVQCRAGVQFATNDRKSGPWLEGSRFYERYRVGDLEPSGCGGQTVVFPV